MNLNMLRKFCKCGSEMEFDFDLSMFKCTRCLIFEKIKEGKDIGLTIMQ